MNHLKSCIADLRIDGTYRYAVPGVSSWWFIMVTVMVVMVHAKLFTVKYDIFCVQIVDCLNEVNCDVICRS